MLPFGLGEGLAATMAQSGEILAILNLYPTIFKRNNDAARRRHVAECPLLVAHWGWTSSRARSKVRRIGRLHSLFAWNGFDFVWESSALVQARSSGMLRPGMGLGCRSRRSFYLR